ncbi:MAG: hypothetical protein ACR2QH_11185, partial [Geminicoccaceae bacterium]
MIAVSLIPPVDHCASCEGEKAESKALDIALARQAEAHQSQSSDQANQLAPGALPPVADIEVGAKPDVVAPSLLAADLAVQASLAQSESSPVDSQANSTLRLQA